MKTTYTKDATNYFENVVVYTTGELGHKIVVDFDAMEENIRKAKDEGYKQGLADGKTKAENQTRQTESLRQIDRMARQIEESHSALRKRNTEIKQLNSRIAELEADVYRAKQCNEREARADAWHEGWKHDAEYQANFGQYCRECKCNPYT